MTSTDDAALALAVRTAWQKLAEIIADTKNLEAKAQEDTSLLNDPWVQAHTRFAFIFKDELDAARTVYEALARGMTVPTDQLVPTYDAEQKLLGIATTALGRAREGSRVANNGGAARVDAPVSVAQ
jgi:hypothetical protein